MAEKIVTKTSCSECGSEALDEAVFCYHCGASLAVPYSRPQVLNAARSVVIIVCGGIGVDLAKLRQWKNSYGMK